MSAVATKKRQSGRKPGKRSPAGATKPVPQTVYWIVLAVVIVFFALIRFRLKDMALERDEGEYAYAGQLILQGIPPYKLAYNMKLPGTYAVYALILAVFGQTPAGIHIGFILLNAGTVVLVFLLARRLFGPLAALIAGSLYALLSTSETVLGFAAHSSHVVVLAALAGILLLLEAISSRRNLYYFLGGILLGLAFVMKQPGLFFAAFGGLYLIVSEWRGRESKDGESTGRDWPGLLTRLGIYSAGALLPFVVTSLILFKAGVLDKMWFWTFSYAFEYATKTRLSDGLALLLNTFPNIVDDFLPVWILAFVGLTALFWHARFRPQRIFVIGFLVFSMLAVCPGFYFRPHYFIFMLPAVALLAGAAITSLTELCQQHPRARAFAFIPAAAVAAMMVFGIWSQAEFFFDVSPDLAPYYAYGNNPFPEALQVANYLKDHAPGDARIAVIGSEPEIYFYAHRHSATGYIYTYPLMEDQMYASTMQREMRQEIEDNRPEYIVYVHVRFSWIPSPKSDLSIVEWATQYVGTKYELVGVADMLPPTHYAWDDAARAYQVQSDSWLGVFRRK